jgi:hypothetical protein
MPDQAMRPKMQTELHPLFISKACRVFKSRGLFLMAAPEGIAALERTHPDVDIYTASID